MQGNWSGHATRFNRLLDPGTSWRLDDDSGVFCIIGVVGPIPKSLEMMLLSCVSGLGNWVGRKRVRSRTLAREPRFCRGKDSNGLGGSARL